MQFRKKQEPWVPRDVEHKLSWSQPEELRVNGQDEPAGVELRVASDTDISKRQQLTVSWWLWTAWMLMMARLLILESYSLSNRTSTPITTLWSMVLPSSERRSPSELRRRAEGRWLRNDQTFNEHGWSITQWRSDETPTFFEFSDRSWIRWKGIPEVGRDYQNALEKQNATSKSSAKLANILWESDALAVNEFHNEPRLVPQRAEHVDGVPGKLSRARWKSMRSKITTSTTLGNITRSAKKSAGQNSIWDSGGAMFKRLGFRTMLTPEGKWVRHPQPAWNTQKRPAVRRVRDSGQRNGNMERKQSVAVSSDDSCSWISHRKHGRWKTKEYAAQNSMKKMTHWVTTMCSQDASPREEAVRCPLKTGDKRLVINYKHQLLTFFKFWLSFFSCIYVTKLAEFLHGVAFVFLEERCYSIEDTRFFLFCSLPRKKWTLLAEIQEGPFSILFKNPARPIVFFIYTCWNYAVKSGLSQFADPNHFSSTVSMGIPTFPFSKLSPQC